MRAIALLIFIFSSMHTAHLRARDPDDIAFPMRILSADRVAASEKCEGLTYCTEQPEDYPQKLFNKMFRNAYEPLYLAREDTNQPWKFVVQVERKTKQQVRLETCSIDKESGELPACFKKLAREGRAVCQQNYMSAYVLTYDVENKKTESTQIQLPSCCSCSLPESNFN